MLARFINYITTDIWRTRLRDLSRGKSIGISFLRVVVLAIRGFNENKCKFRASALTFFTLLSIVPVIALMFGIAKGFGLQERVAAEILQKMKGQEDTANKLITFANSVLDQASGGIIAGIGVLFLFWTIISLLSSIENSFNDIWGVVKSRTFGRKVADYLVTMLIFPFLLIVASGTTIFVSSQIGLLIEKVPFLRSFGPLFMVILKLLPFVAVWIAFTFIFIAMPNTKVRFLSGFIAGIVAGTLFQFVQWAYVTFQVQLTTKYAVYGSFAALPLFLLWLQISWLIVLFGAEVSFAHQNAQAYEFEPDCLSASRSFKTLLSIFITQRIVSRFSNADKPTDAPTLSHELEIPVRLVRQLLYELSESNVISEVKTGEDRELAYQPAVDIDKITVKYVIDRLEQRGTASIPVIQSDEMNKLTECLRQLSDAVEKSPGNTLLKNL